MCFEHFKFCLDLHPQLPIITPFGQAPYCLQLVSLGTTSGSGIPAGVNIYSPSEGCILPTSQLSTSVSGGREGTEAANQECHSKGRSMSREVSWQVAPGNKESAE